MIINCQNFSNIMGLYINDKGILQHQGQLVFGVSSCKFDAYNGLGLVDILIFIDKHGVATLTECMNIINGDVIIVEL